MQAQRRSTAVGEDGHGHGGHGHGDVEMGHVAGHGCEHCQDHSHGNSHGHGHGHGDHGDEKQPKALLARLMNPRSMVHGFLRQAEVQWFTKFMMRRMGDIQTTTILLGTNALGYVYMVERVLLPRGDLVVEVFNLLCHLNYLLAILSWVGVMYHGPGRVPEKEVGSNLPEVLKKALDAGLANKQHPFSGQDEWCKPCGAWKPAMASHCKQCGRCSLWMDHHCNFAGTCAGFKNLRCFLLLLVYLETLPCVCFPALAYRLITDPYDFLSIWEIVPVFMFGGMMLLYFKLANHHFTQLWNKFKRGWPTLVLTTKFQGLAQTAGFLLQRVSDLKGLPRNHHILLNLIKALQDIQRPKELGAGLRGILEAKGDWRQNFVVIFGEPVGWRWFLPLRSGGTGNPLSPQTFDEKACEAWARLPKAMEDAEMLLQHCRQQQTAKFAEKQQKTDAYNAKVDGWLAAAGQDTPQVTLQGAVRVDKEMLQRVQAGDIELPDDVPELPEGVPKELADMAFAMIMQDEAKRKNVEAEYRLLEEHNL
mmetsp:Transcript_76626/g.135190  ORF Transcript_76626/g.135190 Transcript_76626/m.135190 type:complete len:533 (+) Transcript_76626:35-1633(+)